MIVWTDTKYRVVSLECLQGMCDAVSGHCPRYTVSKVSSARVTVEYSNPDEWANEHPFSVQFPCYTIGTMIHVVLDIARIINEPASYGGEGWQAFTLLMDAPGVNPNQRAAA